MLSVPTVLQNKEGREMAYDLYSCLLTDRIIFINDEINDDLAQSVVGQLLLLDSKDKEKPISLYINSPGGSVTAGLAIYDTMKYIKAPVHTIGMGICASMAAVLLSSGEKRFCLPHAKVMIHQPSGGVQGKESDIAIVANEIAKTRSVLNEILAENTKKDIKEISSDTEKDFYMNAKEALTYGLVDEIITKEN